LAGTAAGETLGGIPVASSELIPTTAYLELEEDRFVRRTVQAGR
jgi:hypothetical protein